MQSVWVNLNSRVEYTTQVKACKLDANYYDCPVELKKEISQLTQDNLFTTKLQSSTFILHVYTHPNTVLKGIKQAFQIFQLLLPHAKCAEQHEWVVEVLWTRKKKTMPTQKFKPLNRVNANTGYASKCGNIVVYRKEEWLKTLIHECFHSFNLDEGLGLSHDFGVPALLSEAFSEVWARIILCCFKSPSFSSVKRNLELERNFSCVQCAKVLRHYGKTYADVVHHTMQPYTEHTNIFAYYVLGAVALHMSDALVPFETRGFRELILSGYKSPSFLRRMAAVGKPKDLSLRMTRRNLF
jgi:hypothetical protein